MKLKVALMYTLLVLVYLAATGILLVIAIGYTALEALEELAEHLLGWPEGASSGVPTKCYALPVQLPG